MSSGREGRRVSDLLADALADADVHADSAILFLVTGLAPAGAAEYAYLPPGYWSELENRVLRDVGERLDDFSLLHRFGAYSESAYAIEAATAVGLRHEVQHAVQFNEYGPSFFELESILRRAMRRANRMGDYTLIPSERDANHAAAEYARARFSDHVGALAADPKLRHFVEAPETVADLLDETVEMIWEYVTGDDSDDQDSEQRPFNLVVPSLRQAVVDWTPIEPRYRVRRSNEEPFMIEIARPG